MPASKRWQDKKRQTNPEYAKNETKRTVVCVILFCKFVIRSENNQLHISYDNFKHVSSNDDFNCCMFCIWAISLQQSTCNVI